MLSDLVVKSYASIGKLLKSHKLCLFRSPVQRHQIINDEKHEYSKDSQCFNAANKKNERH